MDLMYVRTRPYRKGEWAYLKGTVHCCSPLCTPTAWCLQRLVAAYTDGGNLPHPLQALCLVLATPGCSVHWHLGLTLCVSSSTRCLRCSAASFSACSSRRSIRTMSCCSSDT